MNHQDLIDRIKGEIADLDNTVKRVDRAWQQALRYPSEQDLLIDSVHLLIF